MTTTLFYFPDIYFLYHQCLNKKILRNIVYDIIANTENFGMDQTTKDLDEDQSKRQNQAWLIQTLQISDSFANPGIHSYYLLEPYFLRCFQIGGLPEIGKLPSNEGKMKFCAISRMFQKLSLEVDFIYKERFGIRVGGII